MSHDKSVNPTESRFRGAVDLGQFTSPENGTADIDTNAEIHEREEASAAAKDDLELQRMRVSIGVPTYIPRKVFGGEESPLIKFPYTDEYEIAVSTSIITSALEKDAPTHLVDNEHIVGQVIEELEKTNRKQQDRVEFKRKLRTNEQRDRRSKISHGAGNAAMMTVGYMTAKETGLSPLWAVSAAAAVGSLTKSYSRGDTTDRLTTDDEIETNLSVQPLQDGLLERFKEISSEHGHTIRENVLADLEELGFLNGKEVSIESIIDASDDYMYARRNKKPNTKAAKTLLSEKIEIADVINADASAAQSNSSELTVHGIRIKAAMRLLGAEIYTVEKKKRTRLKVGKRALAGALAGAVMFFPAASGSGAHEDQQRKEQIIKEQKTPYETDDSTGFDNLDKVPENEKNDKLEDFNDQLGN